MFWAGLRTRDGTFQVVKGTPGIERSTAGEKRNLSVTCSNQPLTRYPKASAGVRETQGKVKRAISQRELLYSAVHYKHKQRGNSQRETENTPSRKITNAILEISENNTNIYGLNLFSTRYIHRSDSYSRYLDN